MAVSRPVAKVPVCRLHGHAFKYQIKRLEWLNPGLDGLTDKVMAKNLILRQMAEIDAFGVANMRRVLSTQPVHSVLSTARQYSLGA